MKFNKETGNWEGTPVEHLKKLLRTHDCFCDKARECLEVIINGIEEAGK